MREYHYLVDLDGRIVHDRTEILDPPTLRFFLREPLDPATHESEDGGGLYCRVRHGAFRARFGRVALQQLMLLLDDHEGHSVLCLDHARYRLARRPPPAPDMS